MNSEFTTGLYAGITGGVAMNVISFLAHDILHITEATFADWTALFTYGHKSESLLEAAVALLVHLIWSGFLGAFIAMLLSWLRIRRPLLGAWSGALIFWFFTEAATSMLELEPFQHTSVATTIVYIISASAYGLILGLFLRRLVPPEASR